MACSIIKSNFGFAQSPDSLHSSWMIGASVGVNGAGFTPPSLWAPPWVNFNPYYDGSSGFSYRAGIMAERSLFSWAARGNFLLSLSSYYTAMPARFIQASPPPGYDRGYTEDLRASFSSVNINLNLVHSFGLRPSPDGFYIAFGPIVSLLFAQGFTYTRFQNGQFVDQQVYPISNPHRILFSLNYELGYDFPINSGFVISLIANGQYTYTHVTDNDWSIGSGSATLGVKYFLL